MIRYRFLVAACVGTLTYVLLSFFCGRDGLWANDQLQKQKQLLSANTAVIEKTNEELNLEKVALQKDMDVIAAYARRLGYVSEGEKLVKISGLTPHETQIFDAGTVLLHTDSLFVPEWFCKGMGVLVCLLFYFVLLLFDYTRGAFSVRQKKRRPYTGFGEKITVYDIS